MKNIKFIILGLLLVNSGFSQKLLTRAGEVRFEASMLGIEEVAGTSTTSSCVFNKNTGEIAALTLVKSFKFKSPLMEEHFNENYMESSTYPKATFKGKLLDFDASKLNGKAQTYDLEGDLTIHGVAKKIKTKITLTPSGDKLVVTSDFFVKPVDYGIKIPSLVKSKIAENAKIALKFSLEKQ
jgi:polyisoprenoid-binding protein YceI